MLKIDLQDEVLLITEFENLESQHLANLKFWGFEKNPQKNSLEFYIKRDKKVLIEIKNYLESDSIPFSLCQNSLKLLSELNNSVDEFTAFKEKGRKFKDGQIDNALVQSFLTFLEKKIKRPLKDHQIKAAMHFYILGNSANFSVPGSGKTAVVLSVYEKLRVDDLVNTLFVVGPLSCFAPWRTEYESVLGRSPNFKILAGGDLENRRLNYYSDLSTKSELYFTSYQTLLSDKDEVKILFENREIKMMLVIDEAHYIKKINGEWAKAALDICNLAKYRAVLTGTPLPKSYTDVFNLFDFLWPGNDPIPYEKKQRIKMFEEKNLSESARFELESEIGALFYRVRKRDLGLTDQNFIPPCYIKMNKNERRVYDAIYTKIKEYSKTEYSENISLVSKLCKARIMRLRQSVSYCGLLQSIFSGNDETLLDDSELKRIIIDYDQIEVPAKITALLNLMKQLKNRKVVIWSNFVNTISLIEYHLKQSGFFCKKIYGATPIEKENIQEEDTRERIRDEFIDKDSGLNILIANPAACSESISLHKTCHDAIYYDLSYNCAQYLQSLDRIHRVGGSEQIISSYYYLEYLDTIESDIKSNLELKRARMLNIIDEDYSIYSLDMFEEEGDLEAYNRLFIQKD